MMRKIVYHPFPLAATIMFQDVFGKTVCLQLVYQPSVNNPTPAVCTLLGLFLCCAMPFAGPGTGASPDEDENMMPVFRDK